MQAFNSKERDLEDWKSLLHAAEERLSLVNVVQPFGSDMSVLEVKLSSAS
jgi:6-hydroxytryprostatin B O-methyltransferase